MLSRSKCLVSKNAWETVQRMGEKTGDFVCVAEKCCF